MLDKSAVGQQHGRGLALSDSPVDLSECTNGMDLSAVAATLAFVIASVVIAR